MLKRITVFCMLLCVVFAAGAQQQQDQQRERTIEELYLSQNIELQLIRNQASSTDWEVRSMAIQSLRNMQAEGRIGEDNPGAMVILEEMAKPIEQGGNTRNFNLIRRDAVNILGDVGGKRSKQALMEILTIDRDDMVRAEAVHALGRVGIDEKGEVLTKIMDILHKENVKATPNSNFAFASLLSIEKLAKAQGGLKAADQIGPLIEVLGANYGPEVKRKCMEVIYALQQQ